MNLCSKETDLTPIILVVDDDPGIRGLLRQKLERQGYQVLEAEDGTQVLELYQCFQPDVVLLDACMPIMDGFTCCRELIILDQDHPPLILMITTLDDEVSVTRAFEAGATDYVTKPINWAILQQRVNRLVQQAHLMQQIQHYNQELETYAELTNVTIREQTAQIYKALELEATLKRITDKVRDSLDEQQILQTAVQEIALALGLACCNAGIYNHEQQLSHVLYEYGTSISGHLNSKLPFDQVPELYQSLCSGNLVQFCAVLPHVIQDHLAVFAFPIQNEHVISDLWLLCESDRTLDDLEIRLVEQVANQCAIGIRQARLYQAAQTQVRELERLNELKDDFLSTVSHELRTPLASMRMAIQMLNQFLEQGRLDCGKAAIDNIDCSKTKTYLNILHDQCEREIALINDLLDLQRLEAGEHSLKPVPVDLQDWLPKEVELLAIHAQNRQQTIHILLTDNLSSLETDILCLRRILTELVNNACKYSPPGASITIAAITGTNDIQLRVTNTGVEIPPTELTQIFDRFYRITDSDRWKQGGTGLGLALVKRLIAHLSGSISASSSNQQVCFTVTLPTTRVFVGRRNKCHNRRNKCHNCSSPQSLTL